MHSPGAQPLERELTKRGVIVTMGNGGSVYALCSLQSPTARHAKICKTLRWEAGAADDVGTMAVGKESTTKSLDSTVGAACRASNCTHTPLCMACMHSTKATTTTPGQALRGHHFLYLCPVPGLPHVLVLVQPSEAFVSQLIQGRVTHSGRHLDTHAGRAVRSECVGVGGAWVSVSAPKKRVPPLQHPPPIHTELPDNPSGWWRITGATPSLQPTPQCTWVGGGGG
jgi:hypothetical protein